MLYLILICIAMILLVGLFGIIGNQNAGLRKMEHLQRSLDDLSQKIREMQKR